MSKKKEGSISVEASNKQKKKGRLDGMLDAMNKRSDPLTTHKVATEYFSSFRTERNITKPQIGEQKQPVTTDTTAVGSAVTTPVATAVIDDRDHVSEPKSDSLTDTHSGSENKVYNVIRQQLLNSGSKEIRIGLTRLKELTGLSDKTIRVAIKSLEKKKSIEIIDVSKGVYGRKYSLPKPQDVLRKRLELGMRIDPVSKHILPR